MRLDYLDNGVSSKFRQIIHADDCIVMATPHMVHAGLELDKIVQVLRRVGRPVHVADYAIKPETSLGVTRHLLEDLQHPILVETTVPQIRFSIGSELELPVLLSRRWVNSYSS